MLPSLSVVCIISTAEKTVNGMYTCRYIFNIFTALHAFTMRTTRLFITSGCVVTMTTRALYIPIWTFNEISELCFPDITGHVTSIFCFAEICSVAADTFIQVLLHDSNEKPMMYQRGLIISPGFSTRIAVTAQYVSKQTLLFIMFVRFKFSKL